MIANAQCEMPPRHTPPSRVSAVPHPRRVSPTIPTHGRAVRVLRKRHGLTIRDLAREVGVHDSYVTKIETNEPPRWVKPWVFHGICDCLGLSNDERGMLVAYTDDEAVA